MQYEEVIGDGKNALGLYEQVPERQVLEGQGNRFRYYRQKWARTQFVT